MGEADSIADVRDMLCAQALAQVARAVGALEAGQRIRVLFNAEDVERDIFSWVAARGHRTEAERPGVLWIERRPS